VGVSYTLLLQHINEEFKCNALQPTNISKISCLTFDRPPGIPPVTIDDTDTPGCRSLHIEAQASRWPSGDERPDGVWDSKDF